MDLLALALIAAAVVLASQPVPIAVRGWARPAEGDWPRRSRAPVQRRRRPRHGVAEVLAIDCETRTGLDQRLLFGVWRLSIDGVCVEEGIVTAEDLTPAERAAVAAYVESHEADVGPGCPRHLVAMGLREWANRVFYRYAVERRATVVGANLPFDLAALARHFGPARAGRRRNGRGGEDLYSGGWSLAPWGRPRKRSRSDWDDGGRPRLRVRRLGRHGSFIGFAPTADDARYRRKTDPGRFVDVLSAAYVLSGMTHSLESACAAFGVTCDKVPATFGRLDDALLSHCRADVAPLGPLYEAMVAATAGLPGVDGDLTRLYSPATLASRLLGAAGLRPLLASQVDNLDDEVLGIAAASSYAGHTEARIVRCDVPVVALDFAAQYPAVAQLVGAWDHWRAESIAVVDATPELVDWLATDDLAAACEDPATWRRLGVTFAQVVPDGEPLPHRVRLDGRWVLRHGPLRMSEGGWWSWLDVAAATLRAGRPPKVLRAVRLEPSGTAESLRPVRVGGRRFDPSADDLFAFLVAQRRAAETAGDIRTARMLKVMVNAVAHGLPGQLNERPKGPAVTLQCWAGNQPFEAVTERVEEPGPWHWPPLAATIPAGGRLLLALAQHAVEAAGGSWAACSTDSLAVIATEAGGPLHLGGDPPATTDGTETVRALSWSEVEAVRQRFTTLNPNGPESPWRVEVESLTVPTWAWLARPGCYLLFRRGADGEPVVVGGAEAGLGDRYADPMGGAPRIGRLRAWSVEALLWARRQVAALADGETSPLPDFADLPKLHRRVVSSPRVGGWLGDRSRPFAFFYEGVAEGSYGRAYRRAEECGMATSRPDGRSIPAAPFDAEPSTWQSWPWVDRADDCLPIVVRADGDPELVRYRDECEPPEGLTTLATLRSVLGSLVIDPLAVGLPKGRRCGLVAPPTVTDARGVIVVGKESAGVDDEDFGPDGSGVSERQVVYNRLCARCGETLGPGRRDRRWCGVRCERAAERGRAHKAERVRTCALPGCDRGPDGGPAPARPNSETCCDSHYRKVWRARRQQGKPAPVTVACTSCGAVIGEGNRCPTCRPRKKKAS